MMRDDGNDGQMIFGDIGGLKLPDICLTGEEKPRKNLTRETCRTRVRCVTGAHATYCPTAVDKENKNNYYQKINFQSCDILVTTDSDSVLIHSLAPLQHGSIPGGIKNFNLYPGIRFLSYVKSCLASCGGSDILLTMDTRRPALLTLFNILV